MTVPETVLVIPCFNEETRLQADRFRVFADEDIDLLFVDDGSTDGTVSIVREIMRGGRAELLELPTNVGKAEAVRLGLRRALTGGADVVGYMDADLATPEGEMIRLVHILAGRPACAVLLAARVDLLGRDIVRRRGRHYAGRVFATVAGLILHLRVYDTQCGAKLFRASPALSHALETPFCSRWAFDVELIGRLRTGTRSAAPIPVEAFLEVPLETWIDVAGSKLSPIASLRAGCDLVAIAARLRRYHSATIPLDTPLPWSDSPSSDVPAVVGGAATDAYRSATIASTPTT